MALNFRTDKCTDRTFIDDVRPDGTEVWHPAVQSMAFSTMNVGINRVTDENWEKYYARYVQWHVAMGYTEWYLRPEIVRSFVGFVTNASPITDHGWKLRIAELVTQTADRLEEGRKRPYEVLFTGERITEESAAEGDAAERGWVDLRWSRKALHPQATDVRSTSFDTLAEAQAFIEESIGAVEGVETPEGPYYAVDADQDLETGDYWKYAAHITIHTDLISK